MAFLAFHAVLEHLRIFAVFKHFKVIIALYHQIVGAAHVMGGALGNNTHIGRHNKVLTLILDVKSHALHVMARFKGSNLHIHNAERNFFEDSDMTVMDAA